MGGGGGGWEGGAWPPVLSPGGGPGHPQEAAESQHSREATRPVWLHGQSEEAGRGAGAVPELPCPLAGGRPGRGLQLPTATVSPQVPPVGEAQLPHHSRYRGWPTSCTQPLGATATPGRDSRNTGALPHILPGGAHTYVIPGGAIPVPRPGAAILQLLPRGALPLPMPGVWGGAGGAGCSMLRQ